MIWRQEVVWDKRSCGKVSAGASALEYSSEPCGTDWISLVSGLQDFAFSHPLPENLPHKIGNPSKSGSGSGGPMILSVPFESSSNKSKTLEHVQFELRGMPHDQKLILPKETHPVAYAVQITRCFVATFVQH
jgi:hypothetical protein